MKKNPYLKISCLSFCLLLIAASNIMAETFTANLTSAQEVPASGTAGRGYARVFLNETTGMINFTIVFSGLSSEQTAAHIHAPGVVGMNALPVITFTSPGGTSNTITGSAAVTPTLITQMRAHQAYINIHSMNFPGGEIRGQLAPKRPVDYDGDGITDYSILRFPAVSCPGPSQITYWNRNSSGFSANQTIDWGQACLDFPAPGDYDGDGKDDLAVYRQGATTGAQSYFIIYRSMDNTASFEPWGIFGDQAVARDYDGDGITDIAVFRPGATETAKTTWWIRNSSNAGVRIIPFGLTGNTTSTFDTPIPGDYDGDGKFDIAVYRFNQTPANYYIVQRSSDGEVIYNKWGNFNTDYIVPGDYDGDGKFEIAAARVGAANSPMVWWIKNSSNGSVRVQQFGIGSDLPTQGDYDGDGVTDISVWRPNYDGAGNSAFYTLGSFNGFFANSWGLNGDFAVNTFDTR